MTTSCKSLVASGGTVLITGASGFIGGHLAELLHLAGLRPVRASIHRWSRCTRLGRFQIEMAQADLLDRTTLPRLLQGVSSVIHCAQGSREVIARGTRNLLGECARSGIRSVVHLSSTAVYGNATGEVDEDYPVQRTGDGYGDAKIDAEEACLEFGGRGLPVVILRPPIVYGPFSTSWTVDLSRSLTAGTWGTFGRLGEGSCNLLFISDLCRAILTVMDNSCAHGQIFNISGPETITWNEYFRRANRALGLPPLKERSAPLALAEAGLMTLLRTIGRYVRDHHLDTAKRVAARFDLAKRAMKSTEYAIRTTAATSDLNLYNRKVLYGAAKARRHLGFTPRFGVEEGLRLTSEWVRSQGLI